LTISSSCILGRLTFVTITGGCYYGITVIIDCWGGGGEGGGFRVGIGVGVVK